jgi:putative toxin-antitoxin system antitoxin component (TIGR02293 family)
METQVVDLLGGEQVFDAVLNANLDLVWATREGLPAETAVRLVQLILDYSADRFGRAMVATACKPGRLTPEQSDVVVRTATVLARAIDVLGDTGKAVHWLTSANRALGGEIPITLLDTSAGTHEAEAVLERIEYGVYS